MTFQTLSLEVSDGVAELMLNRPEHANAIDMAMAQEIMRAAIQCDEDPEIRAVLITGAGKMFSGGGDLKSFLRYGDGMPAALKELTGYLHTGISRLARMDAPVVVAVHGAAAGAGMSLAASGDFLLAAESAKFTMAYTGIGVSPDGSSSYFLPRLIGLRRTQELMITNRRLSAAEALEWGLVNEVVLDAELAKRGGELARTLAKGPTRAYGCVKRLLQETFSGTLETQMEREARAFTEMCHTEDGREGIAAFAEKRKPTFQGR